MNVHRLIQEVVKFDIEQNKEWASCCFEIAVSGFSYEYATKDEFALFTVNLPHIIEIVQYAYTLLGDNDSQIKIAGVYHEIGGGLSKQGNYAKR